MEGEYGRWVGEGTEGTVVAFPELAPQCRVTLGRTGFTATLCHSV